MLDVRGREFGIRRLLLEGGATRPAAKNSPRTNEFARVYAKRGQGEAIISAVNALIARHR
jgi:hypothetical protein